MDRDRIKGLGDQAKGAVKTGVGKATGDEKLKQEGRADKIKGKIENAVGGARDAARDLRDKH
ncbi:MAG TPA: CsbD family protein [Rhizomicrobium sp.]